MYFASELKNTVECSVLFFSRPRSEGWPHHGRTFSIYPCPLSFWLTLPRRVLSTSWCCPSRPCVASLAFVHPALFLALSLSRWISASKPVVALAVLLCNNLCIKKTLWHAVHAPYIAGGPASDCGFSHGVCATERWSSTRVAAACSRCFLRSTAKVESEKKLKEKLKLKCHLKKSGS